MAATIDGVYDKETQEKINNCKLLVVGAGGIGCELLKTLVLSGFEKIHVIDLDTIDLSNLNRQFLFHKQHIGKPKAVVAKESVLKFNPKADITAYHDSITNPKYNVEFYRQFTAVANALDNIAARSHVNRMCMAADVPLIESGSAGYLGQSTVYRRKITECFECVQRKPQKTYPGCTIRNTPSEPVHCIVWAKHLFNQLFGESDAEDEVSPDVTDIEEGTVNSPPTEKFSTRDWAISTNYNPCKLFAKLFHDDILYLKIMKDLWESRKCPTPLTFEKLPDAVPGSSTSKESEIEDFRLWSLKECGDVFVRCLTTLRKRVEEGGAETVLVWDKDDDVCLDFVAAVANLRAYCFGITQKNRFDVKAIAGNIIPAIATTNAIVAGFVVLQILKVLKGDLSLCRTSWINETYLSTNKPISSGQLEKPNPKCLVCSTTTPEVTIKVNVRFLTLKTLEEKVLIEKLHMIQPDVVINDGSGTILISSDEGDMTDEMYDKTLSLFNIDTDSRLLCEDFNQNFKILLVILQDNDLNGQEFVIASDVDDVKPDKTEENNSNAQGSNLQDDSKNNDHDFIVDVKPVSPDTKVIPVVDMTLPLSPKRKIETDDENGVEPPSKKIKTGSH